jgi:hypothetical protein
MRRGIRAVGGVPDPSGTGTKTVRI